MTHFLGAKEIVVALVFTVVAHIGIFALTLG